jgi:hypothetical protein
MKSRVKFEAVATVGKYKDKVTGEERKEYRRIGTMFEAEDGRLSLKLDTIPIGPGWSGYVQFFEPRAREGEPTRQQRPQNVPGPRTGHQNGAPPPSATEDPDDDIPF